MKKLFTLAVLSIMMIGAASAQSLTQDQIDKLKKDLGASGVGINSNSQTVVVVDAQTLKSKLNGYSMDLSTMGKFFVVQNVTLLSTEFTDNPDERQFFGESSKVIRGSVTPVSTSTTTTPTPAPIAPRPIPGSDPRFGGNQLIWLGSPNPTPPQAPSLLAHKHIQATFDLGSNIALICVVDDETNLNKIRVGTKVKSITIYVGPMGIAKIAHITL